MMLHFRPKLVPTLILLPALALLLFLGGWQLQRLGWKTDLIDKLQSRAVLAPVPLPNGPLDSDAWEFRPVTLTGRFDHEREIHLVNRARNGKPGVHVLTPLQVAGTEQAVLVNRGWVPFELADAATRAEGLTPGQVTVTGLLRFPRDPSIFMPASDPAKNQWFAIDIPAMGDAIDTPLADYYILSADRDVPGGFPVGEQWILDVPNDHLEYALTWFFLAAALLTIYLIQSCHREKP